MNYTGLWRRAAVAVAVSTAATMFSMSTAAHAADPTVPVTDSVPGVVETLPAVDPDPGVDLPEGGTLTQEEFYAIADAEIESYLQLLEQVPDEVLEAGGEATTAWLQEQRAQAVQTYGWIRCAGLIAAAVGGALIPASKVVKVARSSGSTASAGSSTRSRAFARHRVRACRATSRTRR